MSYNENIIKKNLDFIRNIEKNILEEILIKEKKYDQLFNSGWYDDATNKMVELIKNGGYPVDVINELAREFSDKIDGSYEAFAFARDALDRRAWELGLRYTNNDNTMYTDVKKHNGDITDKVTEREEISEDEVGFFKGLFPTTFGKIAGSYRFWKLKRQITKYIAFNVNKKFIMKIRNKTFSTLDIFKYLINEKRVSVDFLDDVFKKIQKKFPSLKVNTPITSKELYKNIVEIITVSMLYTSGIVSSMDEVFEAVSDRYYTKGDLDREIKPETEKNMTSKISPENLEMKSNILNKIKNNKPLTDTEREFILKNLS